MTTKLHFNQKGSAHIAALLGILVLGVVGFAGYRIMGSEQKVTDTSNSALQATTESTQRIQSSGDLDKATKDLDNEQSDSTLDPAQLDEDITNLL